MRWVRSRSQIRDRTAPAGRAPRPCAAGARRDGGRPAGPSPRPRPPADRRPRPARRAAPWCRRRRGESSRAGRIRWRRPAPRPSRRSSSRCASSADGVGRPTHRGRQHALGEVVDPFEGAAPRRRGDEAGEEQPFDGELAVVPAPPGAAPFAAVGQLRRGERPAVGDLAQHRVDVFRLLLPEEMQLALAVAGILAGALHAPAEQGMRAERQQRGLVRPELEQPALALAAPGDAVEVIAGVVAQPREQRQVVRPRQHVHRIDLQETQPIDGALDVTGIEQPAGAGRAETLGGQCDASRACGGKRRPACSSHGFARMLFHVVEQVGIELPAADAPGHVLGLDAQAVGELQAILLVVRAG